MAAPCRWFNSAQGCFHGKNCRFRHNVANKAPCKYFYTPSGCRYGVHCRYQHQRPIQPILRYQKVRSKAKRPIANPVIPDYKTRYSRAKCLVFGECRSMPLDVTLLIFEFYFHEFEYLALVQSWDIEYRHQYQHLVYFNIDPHIECVVSPCAFEHDSVTDDARYAICRTNDPYVKNLCTQQNNHVIAIIDQLDETRETKIQRNFAYCVETKSITRLPPIDHKTPLSVDQEVVYVPTHGIFVTGGLKYNYEVSNLVYQLELSPCVKWKQCVNMNQARYNHRAVVIDEKIVMHGSDRISERPNDTMEMFDVNNKTVTDLACSKVGRGEHGMHYALNPNSIFIVGGTDQHDDHISARDVTKSCERYDVVKNMWMTMPDTIDYIGKRPFLDFTNTVLYIVSRTGHFEFLDIRTGRWINWISKNNIWFNNKKGKVLDIFRL
eukprot:236781_1